MVGVWMMCFSKVVDSESAPQERKKKNKETIKKKTENQYNKSSCEFWVQVFAILRVLCVQGGSAWRNVGVRAKPFRGEAGWGEHPCQLGLQLN